MERKGLYMRETTGTRMFVAAIVCTVAILGLPDAGLGMERSFNTGLEVSWWKTDEGDSGNQVVVPLAAAARGEAFRFSLLSAIVRTSVKPDDGSSATLAGAADTKADLSYQVQDRFPVDLLAGIGFNLPTGRTDLDEEGLAVAALPAELLAINGIGGGFDVNPYLVAARQFDGWSAGFGLGYLVRGKYDYSDALEDLDPGDVLTLTARVSHECTDAVQGRLFAEYAHYGKDELDGQEYYRDGDLFLVGMGASASLPAWRLEATVSGVFRKKAAFYTTSSTPVEKEKNYGDELHVDLRHWLHLTSTTTVVSHAGVLVMGANGFDEESGLRHEGMVKVSAGAGMEKKITDACTCAFDLSVFSLKDKANWFHPDEELTYSGFTVKAHARWAF